ncbi:MAG: LLM class flavin-dependent oxidoreductase [Zavarzinia sp.]|nr:LLM class flavin-dependent oxidoreductase [Zavarzinia sp.]
MDFGAFINSQRLSEDMETKDVLRNAIDLAKLAEEVGYSIAWFPEHHLIHYVTSPSPLMMVLKASTETSRIRLGTAIAVAPYYHPIRLAGEAALVDQLIDGRLELGMGRGAVNYELNRFGVDAALASKRFYESAKIVQRLLHEEEVSSDGPTWPFETLTTVPRPLQADFPPMWVAARSPETIRWCVANDMNVMTNIGWAEPYDAIVKVFQLFEDAIAEIKPVRRPKFAVSRVTYVGETDEEALEAMKYAQVNSRIFTRLFRNEVTIERGFPRPDPLEGEATPEHLFKTLIAGSPETCIAKLKSYEALGIDHFMTFIIGPTPEAARKSVRLFGEKVMPHFK